MISYMVGRKEISQANYRFDASFHLSEGVSVRRQIEAYPYSSTALGNVAERIFYGIRANRTYVNNIDYAIPFMTGANIMLNDLTNTKLVSKKYTPAVEEMTLHEGWVLITRSGTVGQTAWSNKNYEGKYGSEDIIRFVPNDTMKGGIIYAYLVSKYGQSLLTQGAFGAVIQHIEPSFISAIQIPLFPFELQVKVHDLIITSAKLREKAAKCLSNAIELFETEIGKSTFTFKHQTKSISFKDISCRFLRFDAQYQIGHKQIGFEKSTLKKIKIGSVATKILVGNRGKREYVEHNGVPFLSSSDMMLANPLRQCKLIRKNSANIQNMLVKKGDILISRSGTVGNTVIVGNTLNNVAVSEHAMKLTIDENKISPEYVFAYLQTSQGKNSLQMLPYGSVIVTLGEEFLADLDLPIISYCKQEEIINYIKDYTTSIDNAIRNEEDAINIVEQEIEKWTK